MSIKKLLLPGVFAISLLGSSAVMAADQQANNMASTQSSAQMMSCSANCPMSKHMKAMMDNLTPEQRNEIQTTMSDLQKQISPLMQQQKVLRMQLNGKLVTKGTQWSDIQPLLDQINKNNAEIANDMAKARFEVFQQTGVVLPEHPHKGGHRGQMKG